MGRPIGADEAGTVHRETNRQALDGDIVHDLIVGALQEGRIDRGKGLHAVGGESCGERDRVLFGDADIGAMARAVALGATYNSGQDCTAATRVYLERSVYDDGVAALREALRGVVVGDPMDPETHIGPLVSRAHRSRVDGFVSRALAEGAWLVVDPKAIAACLSPFGIGTEIL